MSMMYKKYKIKDLAIVNPNKKEIKDLDPNTNVSFIPMEYVSNEGTILKMGTKKYKDVSKGFTYFAENDILFAKITPCMENGKGGLVANLTNFVGFGSTEFHVIRVNTAIIDPKYLYYIVHSKLFRKQAGSNMTGSAGQKRVPKQFIENYELNVPNKEIQLKVVELLDMVKTLIDKRKESIAKLDELVRSIFLEMFGDPSNNEKGFPKGKIKDLILEAKYGTSKKANENEGEFPYLRMNNLTYNGYMNFSNLKYIDLDEKEQDKYLVQEGDLLFNRTNSKELVGKTAVFEEKDSMAIAGYLIRVRVNELGNPYYISGYLNSKHGKMILQNMCKNIVGMANINAKEMQNIDILIPPKALQDKYEKRYKEILNKKYDMNRQLGQLEDTFNSLLQKVFKGELKVSTEITA